MLNQKSRAGGEFRAKAEAIRAELLDESKTFTKEELEQRSAQMIAFESRAAMVAGFTPDEEIESQGGALGRAAPEGEGEEEGVKDYAAEMDKLSKRVRRAFGGPNGYLLTVAKRNQEPMTTAQMTVHRALQDLFKRSTIIGTGSDASGGEFLLPLQQVASIFSVENVVAGIMQVARRFPVSGRTLRIPYLVQSDVTKTRPGAGIAAVTIVAEAGDKPEAEPTFAQRLLTVYKWAAYSEIGDETLADDLTGQLASTLQRVVGGQVMNEMNDYFTITGSGSSQPLGALNDNNAALLKVTRETANTITLNDIFNMYSKHTFTGTNSVWLVNRTAIPTLFGLKLTGNTLVTWLTDLHNKPQMTLLGVPIQISDLMPPLGSQSDIALVNGDFYAVAVREQLTVESSIHYKFKNDVTSYRFHARAGGIPIPTGFYAYKSTGSAFIAPHSPFVTLDDVVTS
ncbi:MAG: phage major capsid protein [bacterium]